MTLLERVRALCLELVVLASFPVAALAGLMVVAAETAPGRLFSIAVSLAWVSFALLLAAWTSGGRRRWYRAWGCTTGAVLLAVGLCCWWAPVQRPRRESGPSSLFVGEPGYARWSPASIVPEIDQFKLGTYLVWLVDPRIDLPRSRHLRRVFLDVYRELGKDPEFAGLCSVMSHAYSDLLGAPRQPEHYYLHLPPRSPHEKLPVIVFLHGSLGNFQGYLWVLGELTRKWRCAIVAPSLGAGFWDRPTGVARVAATLSFVRSIPALDPDRVYLAGLSNGGLGVTRAAMAKPSAFRGLVYLSPVLEPDLVSQPRFVNAFRGRPVLVLHGGQDNRIPRQVVVDAVTGMRTGGVQVTFHELASEDHFLFFSSRCDVVRLMADWLQRP